MSWKNKRKIEVIYILRWSKLLSTYIFSMVSALSTVVLMSLYGYPSFNSWAKFYGKVYNPGTDFDYRHTVFYNNVARIYEHNTNNAGSWSMSINKFADLTAKEFYEAYVLGGYGDSVNSTATFKESTMCGVNDEEVDWVERGYVTPVKNVRGRAWSVVAAGAIESMWAIRYGRLFNLSDTDFSGCTSADCAFEYASMNGVRGGNGSVLAYTKGFVKVPFSSLEDAVVRRPVAVGLYVDPLAFQFYSGGVLDCVSRGVNYASLVVGYEADYFRLKNSWGTEWGMDGYFLVQRDCAMVASYPFV
jgi:hypothetical protein